MVILPATKALDTSRHDRDGFSCGDEILDQYLRRLAHQDVRRDVAKVWVLEDPVDSARILGFYTLSAGAIERAELDPSETRRLPAAYPIPIARIGRLARVSSKRGAGLGRVLLYDAFARIAEGPVGVAFVVADAKHERAFRFYESHGFRPISSAARAWPRPVYIATKTVKQHIGRG